MARKKKQVEVQSTESIEYRTRVKVDFVNKKGKVVKSFTTHNTVGNTLFEFLLNCLRGNYYPGDRPKYAIATYGAVASEHKAVYGNDVTVPSINENSITIEGSNSIIYKVMIPNILVKNTVINGVALYSTNKLNTVVKGESVSATNYSMLIAFDDKAINDEYSLILSWQIILSDQGYAQ